MTAKPDPIFDTISQLAVTYRNPEDTTPISPDLPVASLRLDSLELLEFMMGLEEAFQIELATDGLREDMTLEDVRQQVERLLSN